MSRQVQREYLAEDIEQIRRFFPGATIIEPIETPFDIDTGATTAQPKRAVQVTAVATAPCPTKSEAFLYGKHVLMGFTL